ncbi:2-dehydropantoate 2-reductase [Propionivibrio limicola]|uniref:2-dehydropantoate 2-reductase n=1 Tax=Propionivibrio limicola TaxID=167645 RepID=UPI0012927141|nr:2-dehydropantoate 2-reductase [Propionivibrio limicola]
MRILVLGAGGIGGYFGARIHEAGGDVTFLVRPGRLTTLREHGLKVLSPLGDLHFSPKLLTKDELKAKAEHFDLVILSCKAYDLASAMDDIAPAVGKESAVLPLLNGVRHIDVLAERFGEERVFGGVAQAALLVTAAGEIRHFNKIHRLITGARGVPHPPCLHELAALMAKTSVEFILADNIEQSMWNKFVFWSSLASATCTLRANIGEILQTVSGEEFITGLIDECAHIASASGHALTESQLATARATLTEKDSVLAASMLRDIERNGPTEAEHTLGDLVVRAGALGFKAHCLRLAYSHMQAYELRRQTQQG